MKRDADSQLPQAPGLGVKRILLVDDDPITLKLVRAMLVKAGYDVSVSNDVETVLRANALHDIDVLVTDILMPGKSGVDLITALRERRPDLPIIVISAGGGCLPAAFTLRSAALVGATRQCPHGHGGQARRPPASAHLPPLICTPVVYRKDERLPL